MELRPADLRSWEDENLQADESKGFVQVSSDPMLTPMDDYPIHQTALPVAKMATGDPNQYDRYFFNGYTEDFYFGIAIGYYPNRGIIDASMSVVQDGVQRSVFVSGRAPLDPAVTKIGPFELEVLEPLRTTRVTLDGSQWGIEADITFTARTVALEEERQTKYLGTKVMMDATRLTQWGKWSGSITTPGGNLNLNEINPHGTKDRSWGVRPIGTPAGTAPALELPQVFFLWAPLHFEDRCLHYLVFEDADGHRWSSTGAEIPILDGPDAPTWGVDDTITRLEAGSYDLDWIDGLRRSRAAELSLIRPDGTTEEVKLERLLTFRMRGIGYLHPKFSHGNWIDELVVEGEEHTSEELDTLALDCIHVQQVMRATVGDQVGIGIMEQLAIGPHAPSGFTGLDDGYSG